jgi:hypothetical protein
MLKRTKTKTNPSLMKIKTCRVRARRTNRIRLKQSPRRTNLLKMRPNLRKSTLNIPQQTNSLDSHPRSKLT